jgi:hypothetical protein
MNENAELRQELLERAEAHHADACLAATVEKVALSVVARMREEIAMLRDRVEDLERDTGHRME